MTRKMLVVAALLLTGVASEAVAAENKKHSTKNAAKVIATLEKLGIVNKDLNYFIEEIDKRVKGRQLNLYEDTIYGGPLVVRYRMSTRFGSRQFELFYKPAEDSGFTFSASGESVMLNYRYEFDYK